MYINKYIYIYIYIYHMIAYLERGEALEFAVEAVHVALGHLYIHQHI